MSGGASPEFEDKLSALARDLIARGLIVRRDPSAESKPFSTFPKGAAVNPVYNAYCAECNAGDGPHDDEDDAQAWADQHNAEYHRVPECMTCHDFGTIGDGPFTMGVECPNCKAAPEQEIADDMVRNDHQ